jgi:hypothetical protein
MEVHDPIVVKPVIIGLSPVPYASNLMGDVVELPDFDTVILP